MRKEILRIENVIRIIEGITYLDNIQLQIFKGEILGLIPLDNHGKLELIEVIQHNVPIHFGRIYFANQLVNYYEHSSMTKNPVSVIEKESKLVGDLKVADNIWVLNQAYADFLIRERALLAKTKRLFHDLGIAIDLDQYVSELRFLETAIVELIRAVMNGAQLIILVELSNFLSREELAFFQQLLLHYSKEGVSFLYMAGHHDEALQICERLVLFGKGRIHKVIRQKDYSPEILTPYRLPSSSTAQSVVSEQTSCREIFQCQNLCTPSLVDVSFAVQEGHCLTILDSNNRGIQELGAIANGALRPRRGSITLAGQTIPFTDRCSLLPQGIAYIPEDPVPKTLFYNLNYLENLTFLLDRKLRRSIIRPQIMRYIQEEFRPLAGEAIDAPDLWALEMDVLYSLVYFRLLLYKPQVIFIMQPFAHADMYLCSRIVELINMLKEADLAVVLLTVNLSDTLTVTNHLLVLEGGELGKPTPEIGNSGHKSKQ